METLSGRAKVLRFKNTIRFTVRRKLSVISVPQFNLLMLSPFLLVY